MYNNHEKIIKTIVFVSNKWYFFSIFSVSKIYALSRKTKCMHTCDSLIPSQWSKEIVFVQFFINKNYIITISYSTRFKRIYTYRRKSSYIELLVTKNITNRSINQTYVSMSNDYDKYIFVYV